jgi:hypothetical protein
MVWLVYNIIWTLFRLCWDHLHWSVPSTLDLLATFDVVFYGLDGGVEVWLAGWGGSLVSWRERCCVLWWLLRYTESWGRYGWYGLTRTMVRLLWCVGFWIEFFVWVSGWFCWSISRVVCHMSKSVLRLFCRLAVCCRLWGMIFPL